MGQRTRLSDPDVERGLQSLPGWTREGNTLRKTFRFPGFPDAVAFIQSLVAPSEALNHHPDVDLRYDRVVVSLSTHSTGGITALDLELAGKL